MPRLALNNIHKDKADMQFMHERRRVKLLFEMRKKSGFILVFRRRVKKRAATSGRRRMSPPKTDPLGRRWTGLVFLLKALPPSMTW